MNHAVESISRTAASRLADLGKPEAVLDIEAVLTGAPNDQNDRYLDPTSVAALVVAVATLAWQVYTDLKERQSKPSRDLVIRKTSEMHQNSEHATSPDYELIINIVVDETIRYDEKH